MTHETTIADLQRLLFGADGAVARGDDVEAAALAARLQELEAERPDDPATTPHAIVPNAGPAHLAAPSAHGPDTNIPNPVTPNPVTPNTDALSRGHTSRRAGMIAVAAVSLVLGIGLGNALPGMGFVTGTATAEPEVMASPVPLDAHSQPAATDTAPVTALAVTPERLPLLALPPMTEDEVLRVSYWGEGNSAEGLLPAGTTGFTLDFGCNSELDGTVIDYRVSLGDGSGWTSSSSFECGLGRRVAERLSTPTGAPLQLQLTGDLDQVRMAYGVLNPIVG